jgi:hypothetical protein
VIHINGRRFVGLSNGSSRVKPAGSIPAGILILVGSGKRKVYGVDGCGPFEIRCQRMMTGGGTIGSLNYALRQRHRAGWRSQIQGIPLYLLAPTTLSYSQTCARHCVPN